MSFQRINILLTVLLISSAFLLTSCQKDIFKSDEAQISTGSWNLKTVIAEPPFVSGDGTVVTDMQTLEPDCALDDTYNFTEEGTYYISEESSICSWNGQIIQTGKWRFETVDGDKMLQFNWDEPASVYEYKVKSIKQDEMILIFDGASRLQTLTFDNTDF